MSHLTDTEIQTVADSEATDRSQAHVAACGDCRERVEARRRDMLAVASSMSAESVPPALDARLREAVAAGRPARGATALRAAPVAPSHRARWVSAAAVAAVVVFVVYLILPKLGAPTSLSAAEVLGRSLKTLTGTTGVEQLEYEFFVAGDMPGPHRISQLIDHDRPGRFRLSNYGPDGVLESAIGQDPAANRRVHLIRVDGRNYIVTLTANGAIGPSLPEMGQALVETAITMMQANSDQSLTIEDTPAGRQYVVETPAVAPRPSAAMLDLYHARAVIDERDFRIQEFEASGLLLKQAYSVTFKLIRRSVRPSAEVPAEEFDLTSGPGDVVLAGASEHDPLTDVLTTVLRELGRVR
jgi:hypothetical protein